MGVDQSKHEIVFVLQTHDSLFRNSQPVIETLGLMKQLAVCVQKLAGVDDLSVSIEHMWIFNMRPGG